MPARLHAGRLCHEPDATMHTTCLLLLNHPSQTMLVLLNKGEYYQYGRQSGPGVNSALFHLLKASVKCWLVLNVM